jgi:hypothetical protein
VLPPPTVFFDGEDGEVYWLADGFHRVQAYMVLEHTEIVCDVRKGGKRDATLFSLGANATHGLRRTNEDKRRAVLTMLNDPEWRTWSDSEIARHCNVSDKTVAARRPKPKHASEIPKHERLRQSHGNAWGVRWRAPLSVATITASPADAASGRHRLLRRNSAKALHIIRLGDGGYIDGSQPSGNRGGRQRVRSRN